MVKSLSKEKTIIFIIAFIIILLSDIFCGSIDSLNDYRYITKPAILVSLLAFFVANYKKRVSFSVFKIMFLGLLLSLLGDIFLLFTNKSQLFFIGGLLMFLFAHIMYILVFNKVKQEKKNLIFPIFMIVYGIILFFVLYNGLGNMMLPVMVYMITILLMANAAYQRSIQVSQKSYILVFIGSLFFMLSDSLLAINMFCITLPYNNVWVMSTYAIAQLLIVYGVLEQNESPNSIK